MVGLYMSRFFLGAVGTSFSGVSAHPYMIKLLRLGDIVLVYSNSHAAATFWYIAVLLSYPSMAHHPGTSGRKRDVVDLQYPSESQYVKHGRSNVYGAP